MDLKRVDPDWIRVGMTWERRRVWRERMLPGWRRKCLKSGSRLRSSATLFGAKIVMLCFETVFSSVCKRFAFSIR